jgi:intraflagellar transport protein 122
MVGTERDLGFDPCSIDFFPKGDYFVMSGSDKKVTLWNRDGIPLGQITEMKDWIWSCSVNPKNNNIFAGGNDGHIQLTKLQINQVHGLYQERYAYRELMTDVIIQHLVSETRVKIRCRDFIKKIAIYKDRLAVQLNEKIIIYSVNPEDPYDMKYKAHKKISKKIDC